MIFREGDVGDRAFVVTRGLVEISKTSTKRSVVLEKVGVQGIFGEMALIDDRPRSATATALELTQCMIIQHKELRQKLERTDPFIRALLRIMVRNVRSTNRLVVKDDEV
ncbi:MAG: cyclic nucleotide-binding domain-containing protein [Alphaproteobacteria bacterium]|nr:cyclic nucleotide-binding domain-containing protein [Alphaproteobacteria bacterium]